MSRESDGGAPTGPSADPPALEAIGVTRSFGAVRALEGVDLALRSGEVHALLGENGAGKSTLMNVLYGLLAPDSGELRRLGGRVRFGTPRDAIAAGVGMVHQHFTLVPTFTVAENLALGRTRGRYRPREAAAWAEALARRAGFSLDPGALARDLSVGRQQRLEILKALGRDAGILILDEPTGVLAPQEIDDLLVLVRRLADQGTAVVFITHKLAEVERIADRVTVLRRGQVVLSGRAAAFSAADLARAMIGPSRDEAFLDEVFSDDARPERRTASGVLLRVTGLSVSGDDGRIETRDVDLEVGSGETVGIAGVEGSGQSALAEAIAGIREPVAGRIELAGAGGETRVLPPGRPGAFIDAGGSHIPEDRRRTGLVLSMPVWENLILAGHRRPPLRRGIWLRRAEARRWSESLIERYDIRAETIDAPAGTLSGGNQQKVVIAREFARQPRLLVAVHPTRGLDIRSAAFVHARIREHRAGGGGTLLVSSELDEIFALSDRIAVMHGGRVVAVVPPTVSREELGLWMTRGSVP